jgi:hypothetical protein
VTNCSSVISTTVSRSVGQLGFNSGIKTECEKMVVGEHYNHEVFANIDKVTSRPIIHLPHSAIVNFIEYHAHKEGTTLTNISFMVCERENCQNLQSQKSCFWKGRNR